MLIRQGGKYRSEYGITTKTGIGVGLLRYRNTWTMGVRGLKATACLASRTRWFEMTIRFETSPKDQ